MKADKCREIYEKEVGTQREQETMMSISGWWGDKAITHPYFKVTKSQQVKRKIRQKGKGRTK
nr:MAG TPA: hypothetical protein [Caudoviricetes sp.]